MFGLALSVFESTIYHAWDEHIKYNTTINYEYYTVYSYLNW
jgi:hypothetical protein